MINRVVLVGRLTKDVDLRVTTSNIPFCSFTIAVDNRVAKNSQDKSASFINCVAWQNTAKLISDYCKKGSLIGVEGRLQTRSYDSRDGRQVTVTEVVCDSVTFLSPKDSNSGSNAGFSMNDDSVSSMDKEDDDDELSYSEEDLPF